MLEKASLVHMSTRPVVSQSRLQAAPHGDSPQTSMSSLEVAWCRTPEEVQSAQRLRYRVFRQELGASLSDALGQDSDIDEFDAWCDHLVVRAGDRGVVGTYRVLRPERARRLGKLYADSEFDLSAFQQIRSRMIEVGRACVDPEYRSGAVIMALWSGIGQFMRQNRYDYILGCSSAPLIDGAQSAIDLYHHLQSIQALSTQEYQAVPIRPFPTEQSPSGRLVTIPPLMKGYLRMGAQFCSAPCHDPEFNSADFLTLLKIENLNPRYSRHFMTHRDATT
jgi:putative hemolysin